MLNPFPIQFLAPLAYLIVRVSVGVLLIHLAKQHVRERATLRDVFAFRFFPYGLFFVWYLAFVELLLATMLIVGFYTQIAALGLFVLSLKFTLLHKRFVHPSIPPRIFYILLSAVSISLCITGAGGLAFDLPI